MTTVCHLYVLSFLTLILLVHSRLSLGCVDHEALLAIYKDLGVSTSTDSICNANIVFCEQRIYSNSNILRATRIVFKTHQLRGFLSPEIGQLSELKELSLPNNHIVDEIPTQITECQKLEILDLHSNRLSGKVPEGISSLVHLRILDLSCNKFSGDVDFLRYLPNLEELSLANNMFHGKVPAPLQSFRNLQLFNISGNSFLKDIMPIKNQLGSSSELQNGSNKLVPKRYIFAQSNSISSTAVGNNSHNLQVPASSPAGASSHKHKSKKRRIIRWIVRFSSGILAGVLCGTIFSVLLKRFLNVIKDKRNESGPAIFSQLIKAEELAFLEEEEIVAALQTIGKGGCGEVYKAELPEGKIRTIAIKKILQPPKDTTELTQEDTRFLNKKMQQIKSEIQTVGQIRHRNLLPLLAHISQPNCHYLVYEFMKNGSLQDMLQKVREGSRDLDWLARHRIALGVAAGLEYLHMSHTPRIVHRDLKPANILLDDDMEARISDFGLAKSIPDVDTHISGSNVAGTLGYIAPEYHQTMKFTDKSDIYSFGILLAVLVMGKLPSDDFFQHTPEMSLVKWMRNVMTSEDPKQAIDSKLIGNDYEEQMLLVLKIACFCTQDNPKERPNSKDATLMLAQINH